MRCVIAVGYINTGVVDGGNFVSASFLKPGSKGFNVSDITISGYQEDTAFVDAANYTAEFCLLDYAGRTTSGKNQRFVYDDAPDWAGGFEGGKWYDFEVNEIIPGGENDFALNPAQAIWLQLPVGDGEHPVTFGTAGEVIQAEVQFPCVDGGNSAGNPMATSVWVSDLVLTGYQEDTAFVDAANYTAEFCLLDYAGRTTAGKNQRFVYDDAPDWAGGFEGGKWYDYQVGEITPHEGNDFELAPGQGIWLQLPVGDGEHPVTLIFPQVVGEQSAK